VLKALSRTIYSWEREAQIGPWKVDFLIRELNMVIEADGAKYHDGKRRAHDHAKRDFLERAGYHVIVVTASETAAQVDAAVLARQRALSAERLEYSERLAAARAAIEKDPSMALPRPQDFRFKQGDFRELRRLQARLREPELARQRELTRRCIAARKTEPSWFIEALAGVQQQPNDPLPPRENFTYEQYAQLRVAQHRALAAAWANANPKHPDAPRHTLENRRDKTGAVGALLPAISHH
jgi:very-short-patch-repair endonuclease